MKHIEKPTRESTRRHDGGNAFIPDPADGPAVTSDSLAENLAEQFLETVTSAEESTTEDIEREVTEEIGGPFVESDAAKEYATGRDATNPAGTEPEGLPSPMRGAV